MIDIHSHLLFGLDEGAREASDSIEIARYLSAHGFEIIVGTPHILQGVYNNTQEQIKRRVTETNALLEKEGIGIKILCGAEYYLDFVFYQMLKKPQGIMTINDNRKYVLVEFPMVGIPKMIGDIAFQIKSNGLIPVLAHPERCATVVANPHKAAELEMMGFLMQINLTSVHGGYGPEVKQTAEKLLEDGLAYCVSLDTHSIEQARACVEKGIPALKKIVGDEGVELLLNKNPANIIR